MDAEVDGIRPRAIRASKALLDLFNSLSTEHEERGIIHGY
jgi:hypothetical protein